ncbi:MAG: alpha,alpha-trehalase, partial [Spirosomataceae bacterium]
MRRILIIAVVVLSVWSCGDGVEEKELRSPDDVYGELFEKVQMNSVFEDSKTFVDCVPKFGSTFIMNAYKEQKMSDTFNLKKFVKAHFELPVSYSSNFKSDTSAAVEAHINSLWPLLTR